MQYFERIIRFLLQRWWLVILIFLLVPVIVNSFMKPFWAFLPINSEGDLNSWINFWGNYAGATFGAIIGGFVAYKIARSQIDAQSEIEMVVLKKNKLFDIRHKFINNFNDKYLSVFNDITRFNTVSGSILVIAENYKNVTDKISAGKEFEFSARNVDNDIRETLLRVYANGLLLPSIIELNKMHIANKTCIYTNDGSEKSYIEIINLVLINDKSILNLYSTNCTLLFIKISTLSAHIVKGYYDPNDVKELEEAKKIHSDLVNMTAIIKQNIEPIIIDMNTEIIKELMPSSSSLN